MVGIREGSNGTSVDGDLGLWNSRYFSTRVAVGDFSPPTNDYVLENGNVNPSQPYFVDGHSFSTSGGSYSIEWAHGHVVLGTAAADSMASGDPVSDVRFSNDGVNFGAWQPNASSAAYTLTAGDGAKTVFVQYRNGAGAVSATASAGITLDTTPPAITSVPAPRLVTGQLGTSSVPVRISWQATDATSGVATYALKESVNGGPFTTVTLTSPGTPNVTLNLLPGHTYRFAVSATDHAGNTSAFVNGNTFHLTALQETAGTITYSSGWTNQAVSGAYGGSVRYSTANGKKATLAFTGSQVAWVSTVGTNRGSATVKLDAGGAATISTHGATLIPRDAVAVLTTAAGSHTLALTNLGTSGHPRVDVDAFIIIS